MTYDSNNIFARIIRGEMPAYTVYEDEYTLAFMDVMPQSPGHTLVIPKTEAKNLFDLPISSATAVVATTQLVAAAAMEAFKADGIMLNQFNGEIAGQTVFHFHLHIVPRYEGVPLRRHTGDMEDSAVLEEQAAKIMAEISNMR
jgi:histidine triad (HIT) family protein